MKRITCLLIIILSIHNLFADDYLSLYLYCLQDLLNYKEIGYKSNLIHNGVKEINLNTGYFINTNGIYDFTILGNGFFRVIKDNRYFYTRRGMFFFDIEGNKLVNHDGYTLDLRISVNERTSRLDIIVNLQLFIIKIQDCNTIDNVYFEYEGVPEIDFESSIIFGYLEQSNVSAFYCLLMMRYIINKNINRDAHVFLLETINMLINKLNTDEFNGRDDNWALIQHWIPYLGYPVSEK
jgi:hypothetical protein